MKEDSELEMFHCNVWLGFLCYLYIIIYSLAIFNEKHTLFCLQTTSRWDLDRDYYGPAITTSYEQDGVIYVTNGEYLTQVNYCPFTGKKGSNS